MIEDILIELGLSDYEIKIYLTLISLGSSLAGAIAEKAKVNRRNVYDALNRLIKRGFVAHYVKNNRKYYSPTNPKKILQLYEEKTNIVKNLLPDLLTKYKSSKLEREVHIFENTGGMKTVFTQLFEENKSIYIIGATGIAFEKMPIFFTQLFERLKHLKFKHLWNYDAVNIKKYKQLLHSEDRILPSNFKTSTQIFVTGNKSMILIWSSTPLAILIIDQEISKGFKDYFDFLWGISKKQS